MANKLFKKKELKQAEKELKSLMLKIIKTTKGGRTKDGNKAPASVLKKISGDLRKNINPLLYEEDSKLKLNMEMMTYYQYLDEGTTKIKHPWFLTKEFTESKEFRNIINKLYRETLEGFVFNMTSNL